MDTSVAASFRGLAGLIEEDEHGYESAELTPFWALVR